MNQCFPVLVEDVLNQGDELGREFCSRLLLGRIDGRKIDGVVHVLVLSHAGLGFIGLAGADFRGPRDRNRLRDFASEPKETP